MISPEQYGIVGKRIEKAWATFDGIMERNVDKDPEEVLRDVTAVVEQIRQERHEQAKKVKTTRSRR